MAGEKHVVGPTGLVFGGPHLMGGQAAGTGVGPGYIAELLLLPDAEIGGNASGFHAVTDIHLSTPCLLYTHSINQKGLWPCSPTGHSAEFVGTWSLCLEVIPATSPVPSVQAPPSSQDTEGHGIFLCLVLVTDNLKAQLCSGGNDV